MLVVTVFAAVSAWLLSAVAHLSDTAILVTVMAAAFTASWIATGASRAARTGSRSSRCGRLLALADQRL